LLVEEDERWFSRFAQPQAYAWAEGGANLRLVQREPKRGETDQALACFGAVRHDDEAVLLYFSDGQPNSLQMWLFIIGLLALARAEGKQVVVIIWATPVGTKVPTFDTGHALTTGQRRQLANLAC
jgi:hypothetical protein